MSLTLVIALLISMQLPYSLDTVTMHVNSPESALENITTENGLSDNNITSIAQDGKGFIWIGTTNGLNRFDGYNFRIYSNDPANEYSIASNLISELFLDDDKSLWVLTSPGGLHRYDEYRDEFIRIEKKVQDRSSYPQRPAGFIAGNETDGWWVGTSDGIYKLDNSITEIEKALVESPSLITDYYSSVEDNYIYFSTFRRGIFKYNMRTGELAEMKHINSHLNLYATNRITQTKDGNWLIVEHYTIITISPDGDLVSRVDSRGGEIYELYNDAKNDIWTMQGFTTLRLNIETREFEALFRIRGSLNMISDRNGILWIGTRRSITHGTGIYKYNPRTQRFGYSQDTYLETVAAGFTERVEAIYPGPFTTADWRIQKAIPESDEEVWLLTIRQGLFRYNLDSGEFERFNLYTSTNPGRLEETRSMYRDDDGLFYILGINGIYTFCEERGFELVLDKEFLSSEDVDFTTITSNAGFLKKTGQSIWVGTSSAGLFEFDLNKGKVTNYRNHGLAKNFSTPDDITAIHPDPSESDRFMLVGTMQHGLFRLDLQTKEFIPVNNEILLRVNEIFSIYEDKNEKIWLSTEAGIIRFDPVSDNAVRFVESDGLQGIRFGYNLHAKYPDGSLLFCGTGGCNRFYPDEITPDDFESDVIFTDIKVMNKSILPFRNDSFAFNEEGIPELTLKWDQNILNFEFSTLEFTALDRVKYRYRITPFSDKWFDIGNRNDVTFTNLDPGSYKLEIAGSNADGIWGSQPAVMYITIIPPFWETALFRSLIVLFFAISVFLISFLTTRSRYKARLRQLEYKLAVDQERIRISRDMHDGLGARLTQIKLMSDSNAFKENDPNVLQHLNQISKEAEGVIANMSEIVWALNPENDTLEDLIGYLVQFADNFCRKAGIKCRIHVADNFPESVISSRDRHQIVFCIKEALNNAVRHSGADEIKLEIGIVENRGNKSVLRFKIADNGKGFDKERAIRKKGNGLKTMSHRIETIGGRYSIKSLPGRGTAIEVKYSFTVSTV